MVASLGLLVWILSASNQLLRFFVLGLRFKHSRSVASSSSSIMCLDRRSSGSGFVYLYQNCDICGVGKKKSQNS